MTLDPRAQGASEMTGEGLYLGRRGRDIGELLERLNLTDVVLVGWSMGVREVITYVGASGTSRVAALVFVEGNLWPQGALEPALENLRRMQANRRPFTRDFVKSMYVQPQTDAYIDRVTEMSLKTPTDAAAMLMFANAFGNDTDMRPLFGKLNRPVLFVGVPAKKPQGDALKAAVPTARNRVRRGRRPRAVRQSGGQIQRAARTVHRHARHALTIAIGCGRGLQTRRCSSATAQLGGVGVSARPPLDRATRSDARLSAGRGNRAPSSSSGPQTPLVPPGFSRVRDRDRRGSTVNGSAVHADRTERPGAKRPGGMRHDPVLRPELRLAPPPSLTVEGRKQGPIQGHGPGSRIGGGARRRLIVRVVWHRLLCAGERAAGQQQHEHQPAGAI